MKPLLPKSKDVSIDGFKHRWKDMNKYWKHQILGCQSSPLHEIDVFDKLGWQFFYECRLQPLFVEASN